MLIKKWKKRKMISWIAFNFHSITSNKLNVQEFKILTSKINVIRNKISIVPIKIWLMVLYLMFLTIIDRIILEFNILLNLHHVFNHKKILLWNFYNYKSKKINKSKKYLNLNKKICMLEILSLILWNRLK